MSPTYVKLVISPEGPTLAGTGVTLDSYLDGLRRIVFVDDRGDLARVEPGDLVVALGGGGGSAESLRALADLLEAAGAVGVLVHERSLADQIDAEGTSGDFPVFLVGRDVEWPEVLQPLLDLDALLRHRSHNPELRRRILMRQIIEMRGVTPIDPRAATEAGVDLEEALYRVIVVVPGLCTPEEVRRLEEEVGVDVLDHDPVGVVFPIDDVMVAVQTGSSALLGEDWLPDRLLSKARWPATRVASSESAAHSQEPTGSSVPSGRLRGPHGYLAVSRVATGSQDSAPWALTHGSRLSTLT